MAEIEYGVLGDFPYSIWEHSTLRHLCGYIGLPRMHPYYGWTTRQLGSLRVHGGITWAKAEKRSGVDFAHMPPPEAPFPHETGFDLWWIGFDCGHVGDLSPGLHDMLPLGSKELFADEVYRDRDYVMRHLEHLVEQLATAYRQRQEA